MNENQTPVVDDIVVNEEETKVEVREIETVEDIAIPESAIKPSAPTEPPVAIKDMVEELCFDHEVSDEPKNESGDKAEKKGPVIRKINDHVTMSKEWSRDATDKDPAHKVYMPSGTHDETDDTFGLTSNINMTGTSGEKEYAKTVLDAQKFQMLRDMFVTAFDRDGSDWKQHMEFRGHEMRAGVPRIAKVDNENLVGERATLHLMETIGSGSRYRVPLWNTGIWVTFKPPLEPELVILNKRLADIKAEAGRKTYGLAFSNETVYTTAVLFDFALSKIYNTTIKEFDITKLGEIIRPQDLPMMLLGLVGAQYPNGFRYTRACIDNPEHCNHITEAVLDVSKLIWVDNTALTEWQKTHMANTTPNSRTLDSVKQYQDEILRIQDKVVEVEGIAGTTVSFTLTTPKINEWVEDGDRWIQEVSEAVEHSLTKDSEEDEANMASVVETKNRERRRYVQSLTLASYMRQYSHWVKSIQIGNNEFTDPDTVRQQLSNLSADEKIREGFLTKVIEYVSTTAIGIFGIPSYNCPNCGKDQSLNELPSHPSIIPLDVYQLFFDLLFAKLANIRGR